MKKIISILLLSVFCTIFLSGCSNSNKGYAIAMILDKSKVNDDGFMEGTWNGISKYGEENLVTYKYYVPNENNESGFLKSIDKAVQTGAKIVICAGFTFETTVFKAQQLYPDVKFVLLDGSPHNEDSSDTTINDNVYCILYAEQEAGFLAGYASVKEGYKKLGFMGGVMLPPVTRFGYGFIQGADFAAKELNITDIEINYTYSGTFLPSQDVQHIAKDFYDSGTEVIFSCASNAINSVIIEAEKYNKKVIGVDIDQSGLSDTVITSSMKDLSTSIYDTLDNFFNNKFTGGTIATLNSTNNAVALPMNTSKFNNFTQKDYDNILSKLSSGDIKVSDDTAVNSVMDLSTENIKIIEYKK